MRIAVLVYGRLKFCEQHHPIIMEQLGKDYEIDFFMSSDQSPKDQLDSFVELYKPVAYTNDPISYNSNIEDCPGKPYETNLDGMLRHFINKHRVYALLSKYPVYYDIVVSLRVDVNILTPFLFRELEDNTIYIPEGYDYVHNAINDQIAYGKADVMKKYNSIINTMPTLLNERHSIPHPESLTYANLLYHSIQIQRIHLDYYIVRDVPIHSKVD